MQQPTKLNFFFSLDDVNRIISILAEKPYGSVFDIINSFQSQAKNQLSPVENSTPPKED